jgi:hypothetical protein
MFDHKARWLALAVSFVALGSGVIWFGMAREQIRTKLAVPAQAIAAEQSSTTAKSSLETPGSGSTRPEQLAQASEAELNAQWEDFLSVLPPSRLTREQPTQAESAPGVLLDRSDQVLSSPHAVTAPLAGAPREPDAGTPPELDTQPSTAIAAKGNDPERAPNARVKTLTDQVQRSRARLLERRIATNARRERNASAEVSRRETITARRRGERLEARVYARPQKMRRREASQPSMATREERRTAMMSDDVRPSPAVQLPQGLLPSHAR